MAYAHGNWEFDLFRQTREFVRRHAICSGEEAEIVEAREICTQFTHLIEDDWKFDELGSIEVMTQEEAAVCALEAAGLRASLSSHAFIIGGQSYTPPDGRNPGIFQGRVFSIYPENGKFMARWSTVGQLCEEQIVDGLFEAVDVIIENIPALPGV